MITGSQQRLRLIDTKPAIYLAMLTTKSLGLKLDETLSWNEQINEISNKVNKSLNVLRRLREFLDLETVHMFGADPHSQTNYSVYKIERYALLLHAQ